MRKKLISFVAILGMVGVCSYGFVPNVAIAQAGVSVGGTEGDAPNDPPKVEGKKKDPLPKSGTLSRSMSKGYQSTNVDMPWNKKNIGAGLEVEAPISGSVSKLSSTQWVAKVFNNTEDTYTADLKVVQRNDRGVPIKSDSFTMTLKGKQSDSRFISATPATDDASLELVNWKNLSESKKKKEATTESEAAAPTPAPAGGAGGQAKR